MGTPCFLYHMTLLQLFHTEILACLYRTCPTEVEKMSLRPYLVVSVLSAEVLNVCEAKNVPLLVQNKERVGKMRPFHWGPLLPSAYLGRHAIHMIK